MARTNDEPRGGEGVSRRSFLVTIGGAILGSYVLPRFAAAEAAPAAAPAVAPVAEAVRRLITKPLKTKVKGGGFFLLWTEQTDDGVKTMIWTPETEEEFAEAQRFYDDARRFNPHAAKPPAAPVPQRDPREQALIAAVLDHLDDDAPRLAYADWLRARGNSQGEFVRVWCVSDQMDDSDPRHAALEERWSELLERDAERWLEPLAALGLRPEVCGRFYPALWLLPKGLVEEIEIDKPGILPEQAERLFAAAPVLHKLQFTYDTVDVAGIAALPQMAQVTSLDLSSTELALKHLRALASSPHLKRLNELDFSRSQLGPQGGRVLAESALLAGLHTLKLVACYLRLGGVKALASSPKSSRLTCLDLADNQLGPEAIRVLASSPHLGRLTSLGLRANKLGAAGVGALRGAPFLGTLTALNLESCEVNAEAAGALAALPLSALAALNLEYNPVTTAGVASLAASPHLARLREINLASTGLNDAAAEALAASPHLAALVDLNLDRNRIGDRGLRALASSPNVKGLKKLHLAENRCGIEGRRRLAAPRGIGRTGAARQRHRPGRRASPGRLAAPDEAGAADRDRVGGRQGRRECAAGPLRRGRGQRDGLRS